MARITSRLTFHFTGATKSGLTNTWLVYSDSGEQLGDISWFSNWRRYTFQPRPGTTFDASCLEEIAAFLTQHTAIQKGKS